MSIQQEFQENKKDLVPQFREAMAALHPDYWEERERGKSDLDKLKEYLQEKTAPLLRGIRITYDKADLVLRNPSILVTSFPSVNKWRHDRAWAEIKSVEACKNLLYLAEDDNYLKVNINAKFGRRGGRFSYIPSLDDEGRYGFRNSQIEVSGLATHGELVATLLHELRHYQQAKMNVFEIRAHKIVSPIEVVWYNRVIEADAQATAVDLAYKMKMQGAPAAWEYLVTRDILSPKIARAYEQEIEKNPKSFFDGRAKRAAFDMWFSSERTRHYNVQGIDNSKSLSGEAMAVMVRKGAVQIDVLTSKDIERLCPRREPNYLQLPDARPLDDPFYRSVNWTPAEARQLKELMGDCKKFHAQFTNRRLPSVRRVQEKLGELQARNGHSAGVKTSPSPKPR